MERKRGLQMGYQGSMSYHWTKKLDSLFLTKLLHCWTWAQSQCTNSSQNQANESTRRVRIRTLSNCTTKNYVLSTQTMNGTRTLTTSTASTARDGLKLMN